MRIRLIGLSLCVLAVCLAKPHARSLVRVRINFDASSDVPGPILDNALVEAARLWAPYEVDIAPRPGQSATTCGAEAMTVSVQVDGQQTDPAHEPPGDAAVDATLGTIGFDAKGRPASTIVMHYPAIVRLATVTEVGGIDPSQWTASWRDGAIGRMLGRALAHELGHFLLRWPHHAPSGLMQPVLRASTLVAHRAVGFELTTMERARLDIATADWRLADATASCTVVAQQQADPR